jgi:hypothetical protein
MFVQPWEGLMARAVMRARGGACKDHEPIGRLRPKRWNRGRRRADRLL